MIGQQAIMQYLETASASQCLPRFIIITGERGSGKKTLAGYIAKHCVRGHVVYPGNGVDNVREAVDNSYRCAGTTTYIFQDADNMSGQAKNAMLKITEEPPRDAYFIMTVESIDNTLVTLKSRGAEIQMAPYSRIELEEFASGVTDTQVSSAQNTEEALNIATNPGRLLALMCMDALAFREYAEKVIMHVGTVTGVNAFKLANSFKFKEGAEGYDPVLFFDCVMYICLNMAKSGTPPISSANLVDILRITSRCKKEFLMTGVKKDSTFDMWILDIRKVLQGV